MINAILYKDFFFQKSYYYSWKAREQNAEFILNFYNS